MVVAVAVVATAVNAVSVDPSVKVRVKAHVMGPVKAHAPTANRKKRANRVPMASNGRNAQSAANVVAATVARIAKPNRKARKFVPSARNAANVLIVASRVANVVPVVNVRIAMPSKRKPPLCLSKPLWAMT